MNKKYMLAAVVLSLTMAAAGCGSKPEAESGSPAILPTEQTTEAESGYSPLQDQDGDVSEKEEDIANEETENKETGSQEMIFIGGTVKSTSQNSFVISRTLLEESSIGHGGIVVMPEYESPEKELVTVRYTDSTMFERWTIKGGGADIVQEEAAFSEIQEGTVLEALGCFDGNEFIAEKVIIEIDE